MSRLLLFNSFSHHLLLYSALHAVSSFLLFPFTFFSHIFACGLTFYDGYEQGTIRLDGTKCGKAVNGYNQKRGDKTEESDILLCSTLSGLYVFQGVG
jgi:hypothetical protein